MYADRRDDGAVLVMALVAMMLLTALGAALIVLSATERRMAANYGASVETFYAADAALERAVQDLRQQPGWTPLLSGAAVSSFTDTTRRPVLPSGEHADLNAITADLQAESNASAAWGANNPQWRLYAWGPLSGLGQTASVPAYVVVWIADDISETDNDPSADTNGLIVVRAEALGRAGARRAVELTVSRDPGLNSVGDTQQDRQIRCAIAGCYDGNGRYWAPGFVPMGTVAAVGSLRLLAWREVR